MSLELLIFGIDFRLELSRLFVKASFLFPPPSRRASISPFSFSRWSSLAHKLVTRTNHSEHPVPYRYEPFPLPFQGASAGWKFPSGYRGSAGGFLPYHRAFAGPLFLRRRYLAMPAVSSKMVRRSSGRLFRISSILFWPMMESDPRPNPVSARRLQYPLTDSSCR